MKHSKRTLILICTLLVSFCALSVPATFAQAVVTLDGAYRFVSEETTLTKPKALRENRRSPEWVGLIFFLKGRFSISLMDNTRNPDWLNKFPRNLNQVGYESFAGTYELNETTLTLRPEIEFHPLWDRRVRRFDVKTDGNMLILTEKLIPYVEDLSQGIRVITLARL